MILTPECNQLVFVVFNFLAILARLSEFFAQTLSPLLYLLYGIEVFRFIAAQLAWGPRLFFALAVRLNAHTTLSVVVWSSEGLATWMGHMALRTHVLLHSRSICWQRGSWLRLMKLHLVMDLLHELKAIDIAHSPILSVVSLLFKGYSVFVGKGAGRS